jgi:hypothetical protein
MQMVDPKDPAIALLTENIKANGPLQAPVMRKLTTPFLTLVYGSFAGLAS